MAELLYRGHARLSDRGSFMEPPFSFWFCSSSSSSSTVFSRLHMVMGTRAAMEDISPKWLSVRVTGPLSEVGFIWDESMLVPLPLNIWIRHFLNCEMRKDTRTELAKNLHIEACLLWNNLKIGVYTFVLYELLVRDHSIYTPIWKYSNSKDNSSIWD